MYRSVLVSASCLRSSVLALLLVACGAPEIREAGSPRHTAEGEAQRDSAPEGESDVEAEGLLGTLSQRDIRSGISRMASEFQDCIHAGLEHLDVMGGQMILSFRVSTDGSVRWVYPASSTMGARDMERCLVEAAARCRFERPTGGEVEFEWPLQVSVSDDIRPATEWSADQVRPTLEAQQEALEACAGMTTVPSSAQVTAYVGPGGQVLSAGAASAELIPDSVLDCLSERVSAWTLPDPGSYPAKVSFTLNLGSLR